MKLDKSAIASVNEITEATIDQMIQEKEIPDDWKDCIFNAFKLVSSKGDTDVLMMLIIACITCLDKDCFLAIQDVILNLDKSIPEYNTLSYGVLNQVDEGLAS